MVGRWLVLGLLVAACSPPALSDFGATENDSTGSKKKAAAKDSAGDDDDDTAAPAAKDADQGAAAGAGAGTDTGGAAAAATPPAAFDAVYNQLSTTCSSCHLAGTSGAPIFFGADEASSYAKMQPLASAISTKGAHLGPALTADETTAVTAWISAGP